MLPDMYNKEQFFCKHWVDPIFIWFHKFLIPQRINFRTSCFTLSILILFDHHLIMSRLCLIWLFDWIRTPKIVFKEPIPNGICIRTFWYVYHKFSANFWLSHRRTIPWLSLSPNFEDIRTFLINLPGVKFCKFIHWIFENLFSAWLLYW